VMYLAKLRIVVSYKRVDTTVEFRPKLIGLTNFGKRALAVHGRHRLLPNVRKQNRPRQSKGVYSTNDSRIVIHGIVGEERGG
jgi:hypothetical protein